MKNITKAALAGSAAIAFAFATPTIANAAQLYDHISYGTLLWTGSTSEPSGLPVGVHDKASSVKNVGIEVYCENWDCEGRKISLNGNFSNLTLISNNLQAWENWSDRISSVDD